MKDEKPDTFGWHGEGSELLLQTPVYSVLKEPRSHAELPRPVNFYILDSRDWVNVIALDTDSARDSRARMLLVRQYRVGSQSLTWETPGGCCDDRDSDSRQSAERELVEETGAVARRWQHLGSFSPNPAIQRNRIHYWLALGCTIADETARLGDAMEVLQRRWAPLAGRHKMLVEGEIDHALVIGAFGLLDARLATGEAGL